MSKHQNYRVFVYKLKNVILKYYNVLIDGLYDIIKNIELAVLFLLLEVKRNLTFTTMQVLTKTFRSLSTACFKNYTRKYSQAERVIIMGIESSCDDTGCALIDDHGNILGEALHSQHLVHLK